MVVITMVCVPSLQNVQMEMIPRYCGVFHSPIAASPYEADFLMPLCPKRFNINVWLFRALLVLSEWARFPFCPFLAFLKVNRGR